MSHRLSNKYFHNYLKRIREDKSARDNLINVKITNGKSSNGLSEAS